MAIDLSDIVDGTAAWGGAVRDHFTEVNTKAEDAQTASAAAVSDASDALADVVTAQATADAAAVIVGDGYTVSGKIIVSASATPTGMVAGDLIAVILP